MLTSTRSDSELVAKQRRGKQMQVALIQRNLWSSGAIFKRMGAIHSRIVSIFHRWKRELFTIHSVTAHRPLGKAVTPAWRKEKKRESKYKIPGQASKWGIEFFRGGKQKDQSKDIKRIDTQRITNVLRHTGITEKHTFPPKTHVTGLRQHSQIHP